MATPLREQLQELSPYRSFTLEENIVAVITQDRVIDDDLKRQIKNRILYTCRLFLFTRIFKYIINWSKVFYPPSFFNIHRVIIFKNFSR